MATGTIHRSHPDLTPETLVVAPLARAETIPSSWYTDPFFHRFDRDVVFGDAWQYVGHVSQVPDAGDYVAATVADDPVVVIRTPEGDLRAFYNVCRHRGGPLVTDACGTARMLQCQYHGWTYRLDGSLRGVPRFDRTELFDKRDYGLVPIRIAQWQGLLFVHLGEADPEPGLPDLLDGIAERIAPLDCTPVPFYERVTYDVACNWKVYVDNYLEGYHLPLVHPELCSVLDYRSYVTETFRYHSLQHSPIQQSDDGPYGDGDAFYYFVFPNMMFNILPGRLQVNLVLPLAPDRCRVLFDYYYTDAASPGAQQRIAADLAFSDKVQQEDIDICEHVQRGVQSRAYDRGRFSVECEAGVYHFQGLLKETYGRSLA